MQSINSLETHKSGMDKNLVSGKQDIRCKSIAKESKND